MPNGILEQMITKITCRFSISLLVGLSHLAAVALHAAEGAHPNVIFVLADDLGIGDVSPTNAECKIKTPHLQAMADEGVTFLDAHSSSSVCTPTRYGVLTGRYNWRSRLPRGVLSGTSEHLIPANRETVAHLLREAGYHTQMIGKWHLGWDWGKADEADGKWQNIDFTKPVKNGPDINGFDQLLRTLRLPRYASLRMGRHRQDPPPRRTARKESPRKRIPTAGIAKGPIGSGLSHSLRVLPHLFDKSMAYIRGTGSRRQGGEALFSLPAAYPLPTPRSFLIPPFKGASGTQPLRGLCRADRPSHGRISLRPCIGGCGH